jgi:hypothetical protein
MAEPLKTLILRAIEEAVAAIPMVGSVRRNPPSPPKRETDIFPVVYVYDGTESKRRRNRYSMNILPVQFEVYFLADEEDASDKADLIDCEIYKTVLKDPAILAMIQENAPDEESSTSKQFVDEFMTAVVSRYVVKYAHAYGDPTDPAK